MENGDFLMFSITILISISFITMLAACLCCKKKVPKNDLLGLEGMVKIKNPDENLTNGNLSISTEPNARNNNDIDPKRASSAPHRSLPDIPVSDRNQLDTNSDLYATVGDKVGEKPQGKSPSCMKKTISISQHSSISQADDLSSPYARVRSPSHGYDKVRNTEHPYAQLKVNDSNGPSTSTAQSSNSVNIESSAENGGSSNRRGSHQSLLDAVDGRQQQVIPAASAIAGHVSASQELPYMTPPIIQPQHTQHFSGDSQDSSKGYTSISVREPLANIIAQTTKQNAQTRRRDMTDSHYATVSDDSDEMYAAIEESTNQVDLYTSGSETYAQIQPHVVPLTVAVEINAAPVSITTSMANLMTAPVSPTIPSSASSIPVSSNSLITTISSPRHSIISSTEQPSPIPVDMLKAAHSRQASSSSCTSSVGNLGSPKPEKRQANSPLPPTPKNAFHYLSNSNLNSPGSLQSGRNSAASVIECHGANAINSRHVSRENLSHTAELMGKKTKDLEGMYAKVMKKNKLSNAPSQNTSPVPYRKSMNENVQSFSVSTGADRKSVFISDPDIAREVNLPEVLSRSVHASPGKSSVKTTLASDDNDYETIDKRRARSSNSTYDQKDPGYETIPGERNAKHSNSSRTSAPPGIFSQKLSHHVAGMFHDTVGKFTSNYGDNSEPGYESLPDQSLLTNDPGYETVTQPDANNKRKSTSDYDPNYEVLRPMNADNSSDHYEKVWDKPKIDANDGYSSIKTVKNKTNDSGDENPTYCTIPAPKSPRTPTKTTSKPFHHDYASISETKKHSYFKNNSNIQEEDVYSSIPNDTSIIVIKDNDSDILKNDGYSTIQETKQQAASITISTNNIMLASVCSNRSDTRTITSPSTSDGSGAGSSMDNSSDPQISYNSLRSNNNDLSPLMVSVSNYESLTGSESDPNYETVRYLDGKNNENPYEQLRNEKDSSPESTKHSSHKNGTPAMSNSTSSSSAGMGNVNNSKSSNSMSRLTLNDTTQEPNDYFQV